jgi:uncharacterized protein YjbI with pentapeptide repeats
MAQMQLVIRTGTLVLIIWMAASLLPATALVQNPSSRDSLEAEKLRVEVEKLKVEVAVLKGDPSRSALEKQKLEEEVRKLQEEVTALRMNSGMGHYLPLLQAVGLGSLLGGLLVWFAGRSLSNVQKKKLEQDLQFGSDDHQLQSRKLMEEISINRSQHDLKLFEALGAADPRIRIGAASELGQRIRQLNEQLASEKLGEAERNAARREKETVIRVLIAVTKHEKREELQKHIADLIVEVLDARSGNLQASPLAQFDFQGARLTNAWWKGVDARGVDFYKARIVQAGLAESRLANAIFKNADLTGATLRNANAETANFEAANLSSAKLQGARFVGANLEAADLRNAIVGNADFSNAKLRKAKLQGTDFRSANLNGADVQDVETDAGTQMPPLAHPSGGN